MAQEEQKKPDKFVVEVDDLVVYLSEGHYKQGSDKKKKNDSDDKAENYSPTQPRDARGRWTDGSGSGSLPGLVIDKKGTVYYHGTSKENAESILENGFDNTKNTKGYAESEYATFLSRSAGADSDHSAGVYGDTIIKVRATRDIKFLDGDSQTWYDTMGQSKGADDSAKWVKELAKRGYDGIAESNGEITLWNTDAVKAESIEANSIDDKSENYSPTQPRDHRGRWTSTGGSSSSKPTMSPEKALYDYQNYAYQDINDYLRLSAQKKEGAELDEYDQKRYDELTNDKKRLEDIKEHIKSIDSAFDSEQAKTGGFGHRIDTGIATELFMSTEIGDFIAKLKKDGNLPMNHDDWYGDKAEYGKQLENKVIEVLKGKEYTFKSYVSTDSEKGGAFDRFASGNSKIESTGMETYIQLSSSKVKTIRVNDFTGMDSYMGQENPENEVLFNRDSKFEIYSVQIVPSSAEGYSDARGEGFQLHLYMKDASSNNNLNNKDKNYSPTQPRDERGRWTSTGSGRSWGTMTPNEWAAAIKEEYKGQATWSKRESEAIDGYTATTYRDINNYLRGKEHYGDADFLKEEIKHLDKSMKNRLKEDTTLYRGFASEQLIMPGAKITDKAFQSSSFFENKGVQFAQQAAQYSDKKLPYVLKINAKKGQKGLIPVVESEGIGLRGVEGEFILPRGLTYEVTNVTDKGNYEEVEVNIL